MDDRTETRAIIERAKQACAVAEQTLAELARERQAREGQPLLRLVVDNENGGEHGAES
jgi:hypothetical protein